MTRRRTRTDAMSLEGTRTGSTAFAFLRPVRYSFRFKIANHPLAVLDPGRKRTVTPSRPATTTRRRISSPPASGRTGRPGWRGAALSAARRGVLFLLLLATTVVVGELAGCSAPSPLKPAPPTPAPPAGDCGAFPSVFTPLAGALVPVGTDTTLDLATWNLEFFPLQLPGDYRCPHPVDVTREQLTADLINVLGLDIIAVEEISDPDGFQEMLSLCPGYAGIVPPQDRGCNYQRPGIIYRTDQVTVHSTRVLFPDNEYAFPRSPFQVDLTFTVGRRSYDLHLIVIHLKASSSASSFHRRRAASAALKSYLDDQAAADSTANYMIAGDWNDQIDDSITFTAFPDFITDPTNYEFLDMPLAGLPDFASLPFWGGSLVDHLLVNRAACPDFSDARVTTLRLDRVTRYYRDVSDHVPVMVQAVVFE